MREYYVRFPELKYDRARLLEVLWPLLGARGIELRESGCEELKFEQDLQEYWHTGKVVTFRDLDDAVRRAQPWQGLVIHCNYPVGDVLGRLSIYLWNDQRPERTSLMLGESSTLFNLQSEQREPWLAFLQLVLDVTRAVSAPCCFMECNSEFQTLNVESVKKVLDQVEQVQSVPLLLVLEPPHFPEVTRVVSIQQAGYLAQYESDYIIIYDRQMGVAEDD